MNKLELAVIAREYIKKTPYGILEFRGEEIIVLPTVFPPEMNTSQMAAQVEILVSKFLEKNHQCRVFEMGMGTGAAILTVANMPGVVASASDISPMAVLNTKANALWQNVQCDIYQGNLFENVPEGQFDLIFWNIPFFQEDPGEIEDIRFRVGFDPAYTSLKQFLVDVNQRLVKEGQILLAVDHDMCDLNTIFHLINQAGFNAEMCHESKIMWEQMEVHLAFLLLNRK